MSEENNYGFTPILIAKELPKFKLVFNKLILYISLQRNKLSLTYLFPVRISEAQNQTKPFRFHHMHSGTENKYTYMPSHI
jgi:hypothetical protein